jgi:hypothetical protein
MVGSLNQYISNGRLPNITHAGCSHSCLFVALLVFCYCGNAFIKPLLRNGRLLDYGGASEVRELQEDSVNWCTATDNFRSGGQRAGGLGQKRQ